MSRSSDRIDVGNGGSESGSREGEDRGSPKHALGPLVVVVVLLAAFGIGGCLACSFLNVAGP